MKLNFTLCCIVLFNLFCINAYSQCPEIVDAGTVTVNDDGGTNFPFVVCFGDAVDMINNGDFILPTTGPNPSLMFALYICPPTDPDDPGADPCYDNSFWTGSDFQTNNDGGIVTFLGQNTFWIVPIAADNGNAPPAGPNYDSNGDLCFDINIDQVQMWTFLDDMTFDETNVDDCTGVAEITIAGGYDALFPGSYTVINTGSGTFSQSGSSGENITISDLNDGESYSFDVTDTNGCTASFSGGPIDQDVTVVAFDYPDVCYEGSAFPNFATPAGGTFSFTNPPGDGASIDPFTGEITNAQMDYEVTYSVMGQCAIFDETITVNVSPPLPLPTVDAFYEFCESDDATVTPDGIGDFFTLYENDFTQNSLWTGLGFDMSSFVNPGDGAVDFYVSQSVGDCESERALFSVEILSESPPQVPLFYTVCQGESVTIIPTSVHGNNNPSFNFYGNVALTDFLFNGEEYTFSPTMNTIIYVTEFNSVCETRPASVDILIELPPTGLAGEPVCDNTNAFYSITITTNAANITSNEGLVTNNNDGTFTISDIPSGALVDLMLISSPGNCITIMSLPEFECSCLPPAPPTDAMDQRICAGDPFPTLSVMVAAGVTVDWYDAAMNGTLLSSNSSTFIPITPGTYYAEARTIADGCVNNLRTPVNFFIDPVPVLAMVSTNCSADLLSYDVMIQLIDAGSIQSSVGTVSGDAGNYMISGVPIGTAVTYTAFNTNMSCSLGPLTIISPDCPCPAIAPPLPGADQMICEGDPMPELSVTVAAGETADWYDDAIAGNLLSSNSLTYTPATAGTYYAEARNLVNNCVSTRVAISIISNPNPTFSLISTNCSVDLLSYEVNINITDADNLTSNIGTIMDLGGGNYAITAIPSGTDLTLTLANSTTNCTAMFNITAPDCSCGIVNPPISAGDILICTGDAIPALVVTINAGETVDWYDAATAGNLLLANSTTYNPVAGTYFAETRIIADDCTSTIRTAVTLTIDATPTLVSATTNCAADLLSYEVLLQLNDAFTLQTNEGNITNNGGGSFTISNITTGTDLIYTAFNATGSCSFGPANINAPACPCPAVSDPIVSNAMICDGDPIPTLEVTVGMDETADWYDAPNAGNLLLSNSLMFTPATIGTYYVEARNIVNNCTGIRIAVTITSNPIPSFIIDGTTCSEDLLSYDISITVLNTDLVSSNVGIVDGGPDNYTISNIPVGVDLNLTLSHATTGCVRNEVIPAPDCSCVVVPPPVSDGNVSICTGDAIPTLVVSVGDGQLVNWYDAPTAGNLLLANSNSYTPDAPGFYFAETVVLTDGCTSSVRTAVSFDINTTPSLVSVEANCAPNLQSYTTDLQIFNAFSVESSAGMVVNNGGGDFTIIDIPVGMDISYTAFNIDSSCVIGPLMLIAPDCSCPVLPLPSSSPDQSICEGDPIADMMVSVGIDQTADWYDAAAAGNLLLAASLNFTPTNAGTYYVEARDSINNCVSERVAMNLAINPIPTFVVDANICDADLTTYSVTITPSDADQVIADQGIVTDNGDGTFTISNIPAATAVQLLLESSTTSCNFSDLIPAPDCSCPMVNAPSGLMDMAICEGEDIPTFEAIIGTDETVDWYDAAFGGNLILAGGAFFTPTTSGTFYAETRSTIHACTSERVAITFTINENPSLSVSGFILPACNEENGSIDVTTTGGSSPYMYSLNDGVFQSMPSFSNLAAGNYDIIIEDANGCRDMITQNLIPPDDVFAHAGDDMLLTCDIMTVVLDGSNSDAGPNIVYQWLAPDGTPIPDATTTTLDVQTAGTYTLMVRNTVSLCSTTDEVNVTEDRMPPLIDAGETQSLSCTTTSVTLVATGNNPNTLEFNWTATQGGNIVGNPNTSVITVDATGLYQVNVRKPENGCTASDEVSVTEILPEDLDIAVDVISPACFGDQDGRIIVQPANPDATLLYALNDSTFSSNPTFTNLMPGNYLLRVRDENGCQIDTLLFIDRGNDIQLSLNEDQYISLGDSTLLEGINTDDLANIQWTNGSSLRCDTCLATYTYNLQETTLFNLQITDSLGCSTNGDIRVFVDRDRRIFVPNAFSPNNDGNNDFLMVFGGADVQNINSFMIFDRWGGLVFEAYNFMPNNPLISWSGQSTQQKELNSNVFVYLLEVTFLDGETEAFSGDILLIR